MSSMNATASAPSPDSSSAKFNPSMAIIVVVLVGVCLLIAIFSMYIKRYTQGNDEGRTVTRRNSIHFYDRPGEGLEKPVVDTLPIVSFSVVKALKSGKEDLECAVCLERFEEDESLRLLPKCSHVFHTECIDEWFHSHSTCPLCRTSLKPTTAEINAGVPAVGEVSLRILEAQEEFFGSARQASDHDSIIDEDEALDGSREVGRDALRDSARTALFRNSNSFRQAARAVAARERLATLSARYPASSAEVHEDSRNCIHLSLQRTSSWNARGTGDFYNSEVFRNGSQRHGRSGSSLNNSLGRLGSLNEREQEETEDQSIVKLSATREQEEDASSSSDPWINLDLKPKTPPIVVIDTDNPDASSVIPDTRVLLTKPRSGPLAGKHMIAAHRKSGSTWEQRVREDDAMAIRRKQARQVYVWYGRIIRRKEQCVAADCHRVNSTAISSFGSLLSFEADQWPQVRIEAAFASIKFPDSRDMPDHVVRMIMLCSNWEGTSDGGLCSTQHRLCLLFVVYITL